MRWVVYPDRYLLPYLAPLIALAPVALARVAALFPGPSPALVAAVLAVAWATFGWPGSRGAVSIVEADASEARRGAVIGWLAATTAPGTPVIDCALLDQVLAGAPLTVPAVPLRPELPPCRPFLQIAEPNGAMLILRAESDAPGALEAQDDATLRALGWTQDPSPGQEYAVWRAPPAPTAVP